MSNHYRLSGLKQHPLISHSAVGQVSSYSRAQLVHSLESHEAKIKVSTGLHSSLEARDKSASRLTQVVSWIQFLAATEVKSCFLVGYQSEVGLCSTRLPSFSGFLHVLLPPSTGGMSLSHILNHSNFSHICLTHTTTLLLREH